MEIKRIDLSCDVLVVGGGIGGLTTATSLKERRPDLDILVIEKQTAGFSGFQTCAYLLAPLGTVMLIIAYQRFLNLEMI